MKENKYSTTERCNSQKLSNFASQQVILKSQCPAGFFNPISQALADKTFVAST